ncbi:MULTISPECIES: hypothetical protein [Nostocales]|uniref:Uncharacterized protein n=3 Tax=Nostocales TaxID=1161 RepID=A0A0C1R368_9CYAN|nr:hypothetical protein [Tolypothrix bouteillei]KAF3889923.1 hypothetical protein DA73_0400033975 [Tolypothrix bouteillei VB521301]
MSQEPCQPINLSVHESSDPSVIDPSAHKKESENMNELNDSVHDSENVDVPIPGLSDETNDSNPVDRQLGIISRTAG